MRNVDKRKDTATLLRFLFLSSFVSQLIASVNGLAVPIYADRLGASLLLIGLIGSAGGLIYSFIPLISGRLSDRARRHFLSGALFLCGASSLLYFFVEKPDLFVFIKVLEWVAVASFWPPMEALIADSSKERLGDSLKMFNLSWGFATIVGPILGGCLISAFSARAPFLLTSFVAFSFGLIILIAVSEPPRQPSAHGSEPSAVPDDGGRHWPILAVVLSVFLFSAVGGVNYSLFPSYAVNLGIPPYEVGLIIFVGSLAQTITFYYASRVESKIGRSRMFLLGALTFIAASLMMLNSNVTLMFMLCFLVFGFGSGIIYATSIYSILGRRSRSRGTVAGAFESLIGFGYFIGPLIGGIVSQYAANAPYTFSLILSLAIFCAHLSLSGSLRNRRGVKASG